jgi:hypothetical protein
MNIDPLLPDLPYEHLFNVNQPTKEAATTTPPFLFDKESILLEEVLLSQRHSLMTDQRARLQANDLHDAQSLESVIAANINEFHDDDEEDDDDDDFR